MQQVNEGATPSVKATPERDVTVASGWKMLAAAAVLLLAAVAGFVAMGVSLGAFSDDFGPVQGALLVAGIVLTMLFVLVTCGFITVKPNEAKVLVLFGAYKGTTRAEGFHWVNPFLSKKTLSLRARTLNGDRLKVNDRLGNPIEIASVTVWHVDDTARAVFDVDDFEAYVAAQSETALRHVASLYAYDHMEEDDSRSTQITLRSNIAEVSEVLRRELQARLSVAGVVVDDARLTHLAYAPEIAQAMLRRQQADAVVAARAKIVQGAVGMVSLALDEIAQKHVVELDDERKAAMVSNLLVVLCGEAEAQPVLNTGTLYQ
jgi:regulator of protease activity HflC (stomatin/prohibitin superfamily)